MSRFGWRMLAIVLLGLAAQLAFQATSFALHPSSASEAARVAWRQSPSPETRSAFEATVAERVRSVRTARRGFAVAGGVCAILASLILVKKPGRPDVVGLGVLR